MEKDNKKIVKILKKIEEISNNSKSSNIKNKIEEILQSPPDYDLSLRWIINLKIQWKKY